MVIGHISHHFHIIYKLNNIDAIEVLKGA